MSFYHSAVLSISSNKINCKEIADMMLKSGIPCSITENSSVIPYKEKYSLIGTTEVDVNTPDNPLISDEEKIYLINTINNHFVKQISRDDIADTYSGIRPLIEDFKQALRQVRKLAK